MKKKTDKRKKAEQVLLLRDLAPRTEVKGGAGKIPFGQQVHLSDQAIRQGGKQ